MRCQLKSPVVNCLTRRTHTHAEVQGCICVRFNFRNNLLIPIGGINGKKNETVQKLIDEEKCSVFVCTQTFDQIHLFSFIAVQELIGI